jgi:hypothetical protein
VQSYGLRQFRDFVTVAGQVVAREIDQAGVPAVLLSQLFRDLPGTQTGDGGQRLA